MSKQNVLNMKQKQPEENQKKQNPYAAPRSRLYGSHRNMFRLASKAVDYLLVEKQTQFNYLGLQNPQSISSRF